MNITESHIEALKAHICELATNPEFVHHNWFVEHHIELVERIALELLHYYPQASKQLVLALVWLHDYGKIIDFDNQHERTLSDGPKMLMSIGFKSEDANELVRLVELHDSYLNQNISEAPIEVQIVSSADGCSHVAGPFLYLWWYENSSKPYRELMKGNLNKLQKEWDKKVVLPEARRAFKERFRVSIEQAGELPEKFL